MAKRKKVEVVKDKVTKKTLQVRKTELEERAKQLQKKLTEVDNVRNQILSEILRLEGEFRLLTQMIEEAKK